MPRPIAEQPLQAGTAVTPKLTQAPSAELNDDLLFQLEEENRIDEAAAEVVEPSKLSVKPASKPRDRYDLKAAALKADPLDGGPGKLIRRPGMGEGNIALSDEEEATLNYTLAIQQGLIDRDGVGPVFGGIVGGEGPVSSWATSFEKLTDAQRLYRVEERAGQGFPQTRKLLTDFLTETDATLAPRPANPLGAMEEGQLYFGAAIAHNALGLTYVTPAEHSWERALEHYELALIDLLRIEALIAMDGAPDAVIRLRHQVDQWRDLIEGNRARCLPIEAAIELLWELLQWRIDQAREEQDRAVEAQRRRAEDLKAHYTQIWIRADQLTKRILGVDGGRPWVKRSWESLSDEEQGRLGAAMAHAREAFAAYGRRFRDVNGRFPAFYELQALDGTARGDSAAVKEAVHAARKFDASTVPESSRAKAKSWADSVVARFGP